MRHILALFPSELPRTIADLDRLTTDVIKIYGLPDEPSFRQAVASSIMHLGPLTTTASKSFFGKSIKKAMANHAAFDKIRALKKEEEAYVQSIRASASGFQEVQAAAGQVVS